jgi:hypothetical protein
LRIPVGTGLAVVGVVPPEVLGAVFEVESLVPLDPPQPASAAVEARTAISDAMRRLMVVSLFGTLMGVSGVTGFEGTDGS